MFNPETFLNTVNEVLYTSVKIFMEPNRFCCIYKPQNQSLPVCLCPAHLLGTLVSDGSDAGLHARRSGIGGVVHPSPGRDGTGRFPAGRRHRRIGKRDPIKHIALVQRQALDEPVFSQQLGSGSSSLWAGERLISDQCCWRDAAQESCQLHLIIWCRSSAGEHRRYHKQTQNMHIYSCCFTSLWSGWTDACWFETGWINAQIELLQHLWLLLCCTLGLCVWVCVCVMTSRLSVL